MNALGKAIKQGFYDGIDGKTECIAGQLAVLYAISSALKELVLLYW
ncbi:MAG: hypothetical protein U0T56_11390 [Ferruginibacter sp.]